MNPTSNIKSNEWCTTWNLSHLKTHPESFLRRNLVKPEVFSILTVQEAFQSFMEIEINVNASALTWDSRWMRCFRYTCARISSWMAYAWDGAVGSTWTDSTASGASSTTRSAPPRKTRCYGISSSATTSGCATSRRSSVPIEAARLRPRNRRISTITITTIRITRRVITIIIMATTADTWVARARPALPPPASSPTCRIARIPRWRCDCGPTEAREDPTAPDDDEGRESSFLVLDR